MQKKYKSLLLLLAGLGLILWPLLVADADIYHQVLGMACLYACLALAWNIYALTGAISLGHAAFFGLGAYGSALLDHHLHWSPWVTVFVGSLTGAGYGVIWGLGFKRLRGVYLGLATLAAVEIPKVIIDNWDSLTHGSLGVIGIRPLPALHLGQLNLPVGESLKAQYYLLLAVMLLAGLIHHWTLKSKWGWALRAIRENESAAAMLGVDVFLSRFKAILLSSYLTSICGALYAHLIGLIEPALVFSLHLSALPLVLSIFGGRYQCYGPILGALLLYPLDQLVFQPWLPTGHAAIYGLVIILTIFFFPRGITGWSRQRPQSA